MKCSHGKCDYAEFPYTATTPTESRTSVTFNGAEDFRPVFLELINEKPKAYSIGEQLYLNYRQFACPDQMYDQEVEEMIRRYMYCKQTGVAPYPGAYDDQPASWMEAYALIQSELLAVARCDCNMCKPEVKHG